jgi:hypothetical protein
MIDLTILMDTTVGRPADILEAAAREGVDIAAGCLFPRLGGRVAHVAVRSEDVPTLHRVVAEHGGTIADERECVVVPPGFPGGAPAIARKISDSGIVVNISYFGARGEVVIGTSDIAATRQALEQE